jgi:hypothetical protein
VGREGTKGSSYIRREIPPAASENCDDYIVARSNLVHGARELVVQVAGQCVELGGDIQCDCGDFAGVRDEDAWFRHDEVGEESRARRNELGSVWGVWRVE